MSRADCGDLDHLDPWKMAVLFIELARKKEVQDGISEEDGAAKEPQAVREAREQDAPTQHRLAADARRVQVVAD